MCKSFASRALGFRVISYVGSKDKYNCDFKQTVY